MALGAAVAVTLFRSRCIENVPSRVSYVRSRVVAWNDIIRCFLPNVLHTKLSNDDPLTGTESLSLGWFPCAYAWSYIRPLRNSNLRPLCPCAPPPKSGMIGATKTVYPKSSWGRSSPQAPPCGWWWLHRAGTPPPASHAAHWKGGCSVSARPLPPPLQT